MDERTIIIGGGIVGAAIALACVRAGHGDVTVLETGTARATDASFGWINASFYADEAHHRLRAEGISAWHRLAATVVPDWSGTYCWEETGAAFDAQRDRLIELGYPVRELDAKETAEALPMIAVPPDRCLHFPSEGSVDPAQAALAMLRAATGAGATHRQGVRVTVIHHSAGQVTAVGTDMGEIPASRIVVAAGTGAPELLAPLCITLPMLPRPGLILRTRPLPPLLSAVIVTPDGEIRQDAQGRLHMPTTAGHQSDTTSVIPDDHDVIAEQACDRLRRLFSRSDIEVEKVSLGMRPVPGDGLPVIGPAGPKGLHVAVMHSGVTLAAIAAELTAAQLTGDPSAQQAALAAPYTPSRFN